MFENLARKFIFLAKAETQEKDEQMNRKEVKRDEKDIEQMNKKKETTVEKNNQRMNRKWDNRDEEDIEQMNKNESRAHLQTWEH